MNCTSRCRTRESRGAQPFWQGSGGVPSPYSDSRRPQSGSPEGHRRFGSGLGVSCVPKGESRGAQPPGRRYGGCASINLLLFFISPLPSRKGVRGMVRATSETTLPRSGSTARRHHPRLLRCTRNDGIRREWQYLARPRAEAGVQRAPPFGRGLGVSPAHIRTPSVLKAGVQRGAAAWAGVWGCPPEI